MNLKTYPAFISCFTICLAFGSFLLESQTHENYWILISASYCIALFLQSRFLGNQFFAYSEHLSGKGDQLFYYGETIEVNSEKMQELILLSGMLDKKLQNKILAAQVTLLVVNLLLIYFGILKFHLLFCLQLISVGLILPVAVLEHFLLPLGINAILVLASLLLASSLPYFFYLIYVGLLLSVFITYKWVLSEVNISASREIELNSIRTDGMRGGLVQMTIIVFIGFTLHLIVPDYEMNPLKTNRIADIPPPKGFSLKGAPQMPNHLSNNQTSASLSYEPNGPSGIANPNFNTSNGRGAPASMSSEKGGRTSGTPTLGPSLQGAGGGSAAQGGTTSENELPQTGGDPVLPRGTGSETTSSPTDNPSGSSVDESLNSPSAAQLKSLEEAGSPKVQQAGSSSTLRPETITGSDSPTPPSTSSSGPSQSKDVQGGAKPASPLPSSLRLSSNQTTSIKGLTSADQPKQFEKAKSPLSLPHFSLPETPELKTIFIVFIVILIILFILNLNKKVDQGVRRRRRMTYRERKEIEAQLRYLDEQQLSARDEVIKKYHVFLKFMELAETPKSDYLSAIDFYFQLEPQYPNLKTEIKNVTYIFCDVLYGEKNLPETELKVFRKSVIQLIQEFS